MLIALDPFHGLVPQDIYLLRKDSVKKAGKNFICTFIDLICFDYADEQVMPPQISVGWGKEISAFTPNTAIDVIDAEMENFTMESVFFAFELQAKGDSWVSGRAITSVGPNRQEGFYAYRFSADGISYTFNHNPDRLSWLV